MRNAIYPEYLAAPLYLLKKFGVDYPWIVRVHLYLTQCPLVILNDYFVLKAGKRVVGLDRTRIEMLLVFNRFEKRTSSDVSQMASSRSHKW